MLPRARPRQRLELNMFIVNFILDNYVMIYELIGLLIMLRISAHVSKRKKQLTVVVVLLLLIEAIVSRVEQWTASFETFSVFKPLLSACDYSIFLFILIFLMLVIEDVTPSRRTLLFLFLPAAVCALLYFTSQWTHLVFYIDPSDNLFHRHPGILGYLPYIMFAIYCVVFLIRNIMYFKNYSMLSRLASIYIVVGPLLGAAGYFFIKDTTIYGPLFMSAILLYYLCIYIHASRIDTLTHLFNRQSNYHDIEEYGDKITAVVSVDMNGLKYLNDNFGHEAGDKALAEVSRILSDSRGMNGTVYRVGGDEFIILYFGGSGSEPLKAIENMRENMEKTSHSCAYGYAEHMPGTTVDDAIRDADAKMYENKAAQKQAALENGTSYYGRE